MKIDIKELQKIIMEEVQKEVRVPDEVPYDDEDLEMQTKFIPQREPKYEYMFDDGPREKLVIALGIQDMMGKKTPKEFLKTLDFKQEVTEEELKAMEEFLSNISNIEDGEQTIGLPKLVRPKK